MFHFDQEVSWTEEFSQMYVRSAVASVDKSENSPQFSYIFCVELRVDRRYFALNLAKILQILL